MIVIAIVMSNTVVALIAIAIAIIGLFFLIRDWRTEGASRESRDTGSQADDDQQEKAQRTNAVRPDLFEPDVSYEEAVESADDIDDFDLQPENASGSEQ